MKSIVLVCRDWYHVGIAFLYHHICIRRFPQLECIREALEHSSLQNLSWLVKSLDIQCYVPENFNSEFNACLQAIIDLCPSLISFGYSTPCGIYPPAILTVHLPPNITHLCLDDTLDDNQLFSILDELRENLVDFHFRFTLPQPIPSTTQKSQWKPFRILLPRLRTLAIPLFGKRRDTLLSLRDFLDMPALRHLTICQCDYHISTYVSGDHDDFVILFVSTHGRGLLHLHIDTCMPSSFKSILGKCPLLERLLIYPSNFEKIHWTVDRPFHPKLRWIDLIHLPNFQCFQDSSLCLSVQEFPCLRGVRRFCLPDNLMNWIEEFQPTLQDGLNNFTINVFHQELVYQAGFILWKYEPTIHVDDFTKCTESVLNFSLWEEETSDSDFIPSSEDDSSSDCSSDESSSGDEVDF